MNLLSAPDKTNNHCPGFVTIEVGHEKSWFRLVEVCDFLPATHEIDCFGLSPRTLRFIEDHDVVVRGSCRADTLVTKVVNVLDEGFDALTDRPFPFGVSHSRQFIARKRFLKDCD